MKNPDQISMFIPSRTFRPISPNVLFELKMTPGEFICEVAEYIPYIQDDDDLLCQTMTEMYYDNDNVKSEQHPSEAYEEAWLFTMSALRQQFKGLLKDTQHVQSFTIPHDVSEPTIGYVFILYKTPLE